MFYVRFTRGQSGRETNVASSLLRNCPIQHQPNRTGWRAKLQLSRSVGLMLTKTVAEQFDEIYRVVEYRHRLS
jgi:hypothetical protein